MNCHTTQLNMDDRLAKNLPEDAVRQMDEHLSACESCRTLWAEECRLWGITGNYPEPPSVSAHFTADVLRQIRSEQAAEADAEKIIKFPVRRRRWIPAAAAAGIGVLLTAAYWVRFSGIEDLEQVAVVQPAKDISDEMIIANLDLLEDLELLENLEFFEDLDVIEALAAN